MNSVTSADVVTAREGGFDWMGLLKGVTRHVGYPLAGISVMLALWWLGGWAIASNPDTEPFADFAPGPAFSRLVELVGNGYVWEASAPSLQRIGLGLLWAAMIGIHASGEIMRRN